MTVDIHRHAAGCELDADAVATQHVRFIAGGALPKVVGVVVAATVAADTRRTAHFEVTYLHNACWRAGFIDGGNWFTLANPEELANRVVTIVNHR